MKKIRSIHFVGVKGVGMAPLAIIAKEAGFKVSGCDIGEEFITDPCLRKAKIVPLSGFSEDHIKDMDLVITTGAHEGFDNPEVKFAKSKNIPILTQGEAVGKFMSGEVFDRKFVGVSVAGCHGKTTTTAMLATVLNENRLDPSFVIGTGDVVSLGSCGHYGKGKYFIAEADEYATEPTYDKTKKFLWQHPKIAIFTNIEFDHPDIYNSIDDIRDAFLQFAQNLKNDGVLVVNGDDRQLKKLKDQYHGKVITFGYSLDNNFVLKNVRISAEQTFFWVDAYGTSLGEFAINVPGEHNALNALGAAIAALEMGLKIDEIKKGLKKFAGTKRRFEYVGRLSSGALLFDDYAHHPTEIKKTLMAFRQSYPKSKIVCIFQPHTYSRTKSLFDEFIYSFNYSDAVIVTKIYPSLREKPDPAVSSELLVENLNKIHKEALFISDLDNVVRYLGQKNYQKDTVVVTMGAGDVYKISEKLKVKS